MLSDALPGNVERSSMINRRADEWQAQRDIDRFAKRQTLDRNHRLVMIARDHRVELAPRSAQKYRVRGKRAAHVYALFDITVFNCRQNLRRLFDSKQPAFGSMRIQGRNCNA